MKLINKLSDWKIWLLRILPVLMLVTWFSAMVCIYVKSLYNVALIIGIQALFPLAIILMNSDAVFSRIKQKRYISGIASLLLRCVFLGLQITTMAMMPNLIEASDEKKEAYRILKETSYDAADYKERWETWKTAAEKAYHLSYTMRFIDYGSIVAVVLADGCLLLKKRNNKDGNVADDSNVPDAIDKV